MYRVRFVGGPREVSDYYLDAIHKMHIKLFGEDLFSKKRLADCYWWVLYHAGDIVGFSGLEVHEYWEPPSGFIFLTGVLPEHRNKGLKKRLVRAMERYLKGKLGIDRMVSYASYDNYPSANSLIAIGYKLYKPTARNWGLRWAYFFEKKL